MNEFLCSHVSPTYSNPKELSGDLRSLQNYTSLLHRCRRDKDLAFANRVYTHLSGNGLEANATLGNHLVPMFVECGSAVNAQQVFNRLIVLNEFSWTSLIVGYMESGDVQHALDLYERMKEDHVSPSKFTFMALIKACTKMKCLEKGREMHAAIVEEEYECDHFIGSSLLGMYGKCGSIIEAQDCFEELPIQDVVTWTALITAYVDQGFAAKAVECFEKMLQQGLTPDRVTYITILKACGMLKDVERGTTVHRKILKQSFRRDSSIVVALVDMYVQCSAFASAKEVIDDLSIQDVASWNTLMEAYVNEGMNEEVLSLYKTMQKRGLLLDATTIICTLKACANSCSIDMGLELHEQVDQLGFTCNPFVGSTLMDMYCKFGFLEKAQETFDNLLVKELVSWTILILGYSEHGFHEQALLHFSAMQEAGMEPDAITFMCCLRSVGSLGYVHIGQELHAAIIEEGYDRDQRLGSSLVTMYAKCGLVEEAHDVFIELEDPDLVSWTAMVAGYAELGQGEVALGFFEQMQASGLKPDAVAFVAGLKGCCSITSLNHGHTLHTDIVKEGFERVPYVANSLMDLYVKWGCVLEARDVFNELPNQDAISWTVLINGYVDNGFPEEALICYNEMRSKDVFPNSLTMASALRACGSIGDQNNGHQIHLEIVINGFERDSIVCTSLVDVYSKLELPKEAEDTYFEIGSQSSSCFNALVVGYIEQRLEKEALDFVKRDAVCLDATTFVSCLKACTSVNSLVDGHGFHAEIVKHGFDQDHFIGHALVELYVKCSSFLDARKVFDDLIIQDVVLWNTLVAGYIEPGLNSEALECLGFMQKASIPANVSTYALMVRLYTSVGNIQKCQELHQDMVIKGIEGSQVLVSALLGMYSKFGLLAEAREVFDKHTSPNDVCWNALLAGYAQHGYLEELLDQLNKPEVSPNANLYLSVLKGCKITGSLETGRRLHALIAQEGYEEDSLIGNSLVDMYINCGSVQDAREVFEDLPIHDNFTWTALIAAYSEQGYDKEALICFDQMQRDGISPDVVTTVCSLQACGNLGAVDKVQVTHLEFTKKGYEKDPSVGNHLVQTYAKCSSIADAHAVFNGLSSPSLMTWTALIAGYNKGGLYYHDVVGLLERMELEGISADAVTFICSLRAIGEFGDACQGRALHMLLFKRGFDSDPHIGNTLVGLYAKCNLLLEARNVFDRLSVQDVVSWTALIGGLSEQGFVERALECFCSMQSLGVLPDTISWNTIILGFVEQGQSDMAQLHFRKMQEQGLLPSSTTYATMSKAYGTSAYLDAGQKCHAQIQSIRQETNDVILTAALIDMYGKCGEVSAAQELFNASSVKDVATWNALVAGYTGQGKNEQAFASLQKLLKYVRPDQATLVTAITACSHVGFVELGQHYFWRMTEDYGIEPTIKHYNCLLDLLARAGQIDEAVMIVSKIPFEVDFVVWSTLMGACQKWGNSLHGRRAFRHAMREEESHNALFVLMANLQAHALKFEEDESIDAIASSK